MEKVKVLHLITHMGFGGSEEDTLVIVKGLSRHRYEVHLAAGRDYTDWEARGQECSDAFFSFPDLRRPVHPLADIRALNQITALMRDHHYDIVHTHCAKAGVVGRIAARRAGVPIVVHTYHLFGWQAAHASSIEKRLYFLAERYAASLSDALTTMCEMNEKEAIDLHLAPPEKFTTIHSGIDLNHFRVTSGRVETCRGLGVNPGQPIVGTIGRLSTQKAPLDFVRAARIILQRKPDVQFILVGDGPLASEVQQAIGDEHRIKMLGFRDNVPEILSILDVFVLPSLWEGLARAVIEAMVMSVPVAVTAVDGMPELVTHMKTGLLSPPQNPAQLAENIAWFLDRPDEARKMGQRGRERVVPAFSVETVVEQTEALYERLLAQKGRSAVVSASRRHAAREQSGALGGTP